MAAAVDHRRVVQVLGDAHEELAQQEGAESRRHERCGQALERVLPAERPDEVVGDDGRFPRDHHRGEEDQERRFLPREGNKGKGIGSQRCVKELPNITSPDWMMLLSR